MSQRVDFSSLSPLAKAGMVLLTVGMIVAISGLLNSMGLEFKGMSFLDGVLGEGFEGRLFAGIPTLLVGGVLFRLGGGKEALAAQKGK